jgi:hypothetical protein
MAATYPLTTLGINTGVSECYVRHYATRYRQFQYPHISTAYITTSIFVVDYELTQKKKELIIDEMLRMHMATRQEN